MTHPFDNPADMQASIEDGVLTLDFNWLPVSKLLNLRQSGEGLSAKECHSWLEAAASAVEGLDRRLDTSFDALVRIGAEPFIIEVLVPAAAADGTIDKLMEPAIDFFTREGIRVARLSTLRPRSMTSSV